MRKFFTYAFVVVCGLGLYPLTASAQLETTNEMLSLCDGTSTGTFGEDFCTGYLSGVLDTAALEGELREDPIFCFPINGVTVNEAIAIIESYSRRNPSVYEEEFLATMYFAMLEKYPCI